MYFCIFRSSAVLISKAGRTTVGIHHPNVSFAFAKYGLQLFITHATADKPMVRFADLFIKISKDGAMPTAFISNTL